MVDECGKSFDEPRPGPLRDLAGLRVSDLASAADLQLPSTRVPISDGDPLQASLCADELHLDDAEPIAAHADGWRKGLPAITLNKRGKGQVYVGARLDQPSITLLVEWLCKIGQIRQQFKRPEGVSVTSGAVRECGCCLW